MEDKRLDRLFDYTKFHIGIYVSTGGALVTLIGLAAAKAEEGAYIAKLVGSPTALAISFFLMVVAGMAGGVIASSSTECKSYEDLWAQPQGPFGLRIVTGRIWAAIEHAAFWMSALAFSYSILSAAAVRHWLF